VRVLNIYKGHNKELMRQCNRLEEYSIFIAKIDEGLVQGMGSQQAIETAINYCIDHNIMSDILSQHRAEVVGMLLMEYDEQKTMDYLRKEAMEDGRLEGREEGREESRMFDLLNLMETMNLTPEEAVKALKVPEEKRDYYIDKLKSKP
jgi:predicted transposase YdaD